MTDSTIKVWFNASLKTWAFRGLSTLLIVSGTLLFREIGPPIFDSVSKLALWGVIGLLFSVCLVMAVYLISSYSPLKLSLGLLWDSKLNPHCVLCRKPTTMPKVGRDSGVAMRCLGCILFIDVVDHDGESVDRLDVLYGLVESDLGWKKPGAK